MKSKIFTLAMLFAFIANMNAQTVLFEEDFESSALIPETFTLINNDGFTAASDGDEVWNDSAWAVVSSSRPELEGTQVAAALSYYTDMGDATADDWMILPAITLGASSTLSWEAMSLTSSGDYPDDYQVIIAEAEADSDPTVDYMFTNGTILLDQDAEWWSAAVSTPGEGLHTHELDLTDYADMDVWIAFRQNTGNGGGYLIAIDNIKVEEGSSTAIETVDATFAVNIYPNPTTDVAQVAFTSDVNNGSLSIYDITGRMVKDMQLNQLNIGENNIELNVNDLQTGTYIVTLQLNNKVVTQKLMVQ